MRFIARFMRIFFDYFYHDFAWTYDFVAAAVSIGRWNSWTRTTLPFIRGSRVLEIGHGPGYLQSQLRQKFNFVVGLDESTQMGRLAQQRLEKAGPSELKLIRARAQTMPFCSGTFDSIVSTFPSEYIYSPATLTNIYRVLKEEGCFILLPAAWILGGKSLDRLAAWLFQITGEAPREISSLINSRMSSTLEQAGFNVEVKRIEIRESVVILVIASKTAYAGRV
jgi:ubiquinone/menaquinone biosynthesis C-methylase UbiE